MLQVLEPGQHCQLQGHGPYLGQSLAFSGVVLTLHFALQGPCPVQASWVEVAPQVWTLGGDRAAGLLGLHPPMVLQPLLPLLPG